MKSIGKVIACVLAVLVAIGAIILRLHTIDAREAEIIAEQKQEEEYMGTCGSPLDGSITMRFGVISEIKENSIVFLMDEGGLEEVKVGNPQDFNTDRYYCLFYQGGEVVKAWEEHW